MTCFAEDASQGPNENKDTSLIRNLVIYLITKHLQPVNSIEDIIAQSAMCHELYYK